MLDSKPNDGNSQQSQPKQYQKQVANIPEIDIDMDDQFLLKEVKPHLYPSGDLKK